MQAISLLRSDLYHSIEIKNEELTNKKQQYSYALLYTFIIGSLKTAALSVQ